MDFRPVSLEKGESMTTLEIISYSILSVVLIYTIYTNEKNLR